MAVGIGRFGRGRVCEEARSSPHVLASLCRDDLALRGSHIISDLTLVDEAGVDVGAREVRVLHGKCFFFLNETHVLAKDREQPEDEEAIQKEGNGMSEGELRGDIISAMDHPFE